MQESFASINFQVLQDLLLIGHFFNESNTNFAFFDVGKKGREKVPVIVQKLLITLQPFHHLSISQTILRQVEKPAFRISHELI